MQDTVDRKLKAVILVDRTQDVGFARDLCGQPVFILQQCTQLIQRDDIVGVGNSQRQMLVDGINR